MELKRVGTQASTMGPATAMTHIAVQEALNGKPVDWPEAVPDEDYLGGKQ